MAEFKWSMLCHRACIDKNSNMLSILDVTDVITVERLLSPIPENAALPVNLQMISMWHRSERDSPEKFWASFTIEMPDGEVFVPETTLEGDLQEHLRTRLLFGIQAIPFKGKGVYTFNVLVASQPGGPYEQVARVPLEIMMSAEADPSSAIEPGQPSEPTASAPPESSSQPVPSPPSRRPASPKRRRRGSS